MTEIKTEKYTSDQRVKIDDDEKLTIAGNLVDEMVKRDAAEDSMKETMKQLKIDIERREADIAVMREQVRTGFKIAAVECERQWHYDSCLFRTVRLDTGEVLGSRPLYDNERQPELPMEGK